MAYWLLKTEPGAYAFADLVREGRTAWSGVKNPTAQRNLRSMREGDEALVYHTGDEKAAVGQCRVVRAAYPDPTSPGGALACVDLAPGAGLKGPVSLSAMKGHPAFAGSPLVSQGRLSVVPITPAQWKAVRDLAGAGDR